MMTLPRAVSSVVDTGKTLAVLPLCAAAITVLGNVVIAVPAQANPNVGGLCGMGGDEGGLVQRNAGPGDQVCVERSVAAAVAQENQTAADRRDPNGAYGPLSCVSGFVWREAFDGDGVCVTPARRDQTLAENASFQQVQWDLRGW